MRFRANLTLVALFIVNAFMASLNLAVSSDALASQPHSHLFREATERGSVSGKSQPSETLPFHWTQRGTRTCSPSSS